MVSGILSEMTLDEVREFHPEVVVLPTGSTEPHGPHLPYGMDCLHAEGFCRRAVEKANGSDARVLMYPTLPVGNNVNFRAWPFACRIGVRTLIQVLLDIFVALEEDGIRKIFILSGHSGNDAAINAAMREHMGTRSPESLDRAFICAADIPAFTPPQTRAKITDASDHAGDHETSRLCYMRPEMVRSDARRESPIVLPQLEALRKYNIAYIRPWHLHMPNCAGGSPQNATAEKGKAIIEGGSDALADFLVELSRTPWHKNFPYPRD